MTDLYIFFVALAATILLLQTQLALRDFEWPRRQQALVILSGFFLSLLGAKIMGAWGQWLVRWQWIWGPVSVTGLYLFLCPAAFLWARRQGALGRVLLRRWSWGFPLAQCVGRLGCFFAGCCWGFCPLRIGGFSLEGRFSLAGEHFSWPLLESGISFFSFLFFYFALRRWTPEKLFRASLLFYAVTRFFLEFFRGDFIRGEATLMGVNLSFPQWAMLLLVLWLFLDWGLQRVFKKRA